MKRFFKLTFFLSFLLLAYLIFSPTHNKAFAGPICTSLGGTCTGNIICLGEGVSKGLQDCTAPSVCCTFPYCSTANTRDCLYGCTPTATGGTCKAAPTPASIPNPICTSLGGTCTGLQLCLGEGVSKGLQDCTAPSVCCTLPYCSTANTKDCTYGCTPTTTGGTCKAAPETPQAPPTQDCYYAGCDSDTGDYNINAICNGDVCQTAIGPINTTDFGGFAKSIFSVLLSVAGVIATILIIISGYKLVLSRGNPEKVNDAREQLTSAIVGLLFIIFSLVFLEFIGLDILGIPKFF